MTHSQRLRSLAGVLAALDGALPAFAAAALAALSRPERPVPPAPGTRPPPLRHAAVPVYQVPGRTAMTGGMPRCRIALIADGATLAAATVAVLSGARSQPRRKTPMAAAAVSARHVAELVSWTGRERLRALRQAAGQGGQATKETKAPESSHTRLAMPRPPGRTGHRGHGKPRTPALTSSTGGTWRSQSPGSAERAKRIWLIAPPRVQSPKRPASRRVEEDT
jgi:hypothetical protein